MSVEGLGVRRVSLYMVVYTLSLAGTERRPEERTRRGERRRGDEVTGDKKGNTRTLTIGYVHGKLRKKGHSNVLKVSGNMQEENVVQSQETKKEKSHIMRHEVNVSPRFTAYLHSDWS